ncbi:hypothetical protein JD844_004546 [Phrynosoma platyrhinos]|uniref:Haloacid dehalogenase-like hydrolase domain-containing protein 3 n=1 Tax=Phrynosoma platyrhinos TaxID=52577 RepID=A0ABQ7SDF2_PHRPL|nr:hypothetical protein JD844_004546 [Phrynosoma platyrhinos]
MLRLRLLTWDVKDTLIRLRLPVGESYSAGAQAWGLQVSAESLEASFHKAHRVQSQRFPNYGLAKGLGSKQWWLDVVLETFRLSGVQDKVLLRPLAEKLYQDYSSPDNWELLPAARETLHQCQQLGIPMAVVSNFDQRLPDVLTCCGLRQHFAFVLSSEEAGFAKPDKRIFLEALRISGVAPQLAAHVGDDYENDYKAAREAGMHSFLLKGVAGQMGDWRQVEVPHSHLLESLSQLPSRIEKD